MFMGLIDGLLNTALDVASAPIDVLKDVVEGNENNRTQRKVGKTLQDFGSIFDFMD